MLNLSFGLYNKSIFLSFVYFVYCITSIFGFGLFFKKYYREHFYVPFYGLSILITLGPLFFSTITYNLLLYIIFPLGFLFAASYYLLKIKSFLLNNLFFSFLICFYFFFAFYQFSHNYDDLAGYFPIIESFKNRIFTFEGFDVRNFYSYPSIFFVTSIFQQNGNLYQAKFVDIFFGILLCLIFFNSYFKKNSTIIKYKNFILFFIPIYIFSASTSITAHMIATPFLFIVLYELSIIKQKISNKINIFNFFFFSGVCFVISFKFIPFIFFLLLFYFYFCLKKSLLFKCFYSYLPFFFLPICTWSFYSYLNFGTPISLLSNGISFLSYPNYQELYHLITFTDLNIFYYLFEKIKLLFFSGNKIFYIFYQFTYHHSLFLLILGFYFFYLTKNFNFILILLLYILSICSYFFSEQATVSYYFRYIYPATIAASLFFLYEYLNNNKKNINNKNLIIIFFLFFLIFEKLDYPKHFRNYLQILGVDTRFYKKNTHSFPYYHRLGLLNGLYDPDLLNNLNNITKDLTNKKILTYINEPYLLNFKKNSIIFIDFYMFHTSPNPGYPFDKSFNEKLYYFRNLNIEYILVDIELINYFTQNKRDNYFSYDKQEPLFYILNKNFSNFISECLENFDSRKINQYILIKL